MKNATEKPRWQAASPSARAVWLLPVPLLPSAMTFSRSHELAAGQFEHQHLVDAGDGGELEGLEGFDGGKVRGANAALDHAAFAVDELELNQAHQIAGVIEAFSGALGCELGVFAQNGRQLQLLEMMSEKDLGLSAHAANLVVWPVA